jgi:hypothetical protein
VLARMWQKDWGIRVGAVIAVLTLFTMGCLYWNTREAHTMMVRQAENDFQRSFLHLNDMMQKIENELGNMELIHAPAAQKRSWAQIWRYAQMAQQDFSQLPLVWSPMQKTQLFLHELQMTAFRQAIHHASEPVPAVGSIHDWQKRTKQLRSAMEQVQQEVLREDSNWHELLPMQAQSLSKNSRSQRPFDLSSDQAERIIHPMSQRLDGIDRKIISMTSTPEKANNSPDMILPEQKSKSQQRESIVLPKNTNESAVRLLAARWSTRMKGQSVTAASWGTISPIVWNGRTGCSLRSMDGQETIQFSGDTCKTIVSYASQHQPDVWKLKESDVRRAMLKRMSEWFGGQWAIDQLQSNHRWITLKIVPLQGNIRLLSDYVTVRVSMDRGAILSLDASAYVNGVRPRKIPNVQWDQAAMIELLDPQVKWSYGYPILKSDEFGVEVPCARWFGAYDGNRVQVDINTRSGEVESVERWKES